MTILYLCRGCTIFMGEGSDNKEVVCPNCGHPGPHIGGQFADDEAAILMEGGETS